MNMNSKREMSSPNRLEHGKAIVCHLFESFFPQQHGGFDLVTTPTENMGFGLFHRYPGMGGYVESFVLVSKAILAVLETQ